MIDYNDFLNDTIVSLPPSGIRKFFDIANEMQDVISLSIGEPDFKTPWHVREAGIESLERGRTWYSPNRGFAELREEISKYFSRRFYVDYDPKTDVLVSVGGSEAIDLAIRTLVTPGDDVLIVEPSFVCYRPMVIAAQGNPVIIQTKEKDSFKLTAEELQKSITPKTKLLILPFPNNPTGAVMRENELLEISKLVKEHNLMVISDEIYAELTYGDAQHVAFSKLPDMKERSVIINGFSKSYAMTGWRLGYAVGPKEIISQMTKLHQYAVMCAPTTAQYAAIEALKNGDRDIARMRSEYDMRRRFIVDELRKIGFSCFEPEGAFYVFPNITITGMTSEEFCCRLLETKHIAVIPGNAFGECGEGFVRISYSYSLKHIKEALSRIKEFVDEILN
ncbi:MAG: aminotransferase class I/II-fold pyridoxal phosphate-dependent enzyme [Clostridia bacterium]|nr:aminotransferase class I/II-fold pyridoxal phosphate-dependent enzyme [Clostridia bacterium]